jgi:hypothetical protein
MKITVTCAQCSFWITYDSHDAIVDYECGRVEKEDCYIDHHPQEKEVTSIMNKHKAEYAM